MEQMQLLEKPALTLPIDARKRPTRNDSLIIRDAAACIANTLISEESYDKKDRDELIAHLAELDWQEAFQNGKELEKKGYRVNANVIEILDMFDVELFNALDKAERDWRKAIEYTPAFKVEDTVKIERDGEQYEGVVTFVDDARLYYTVKVKALGHVDSGTIGTHGILLPCEKLDAFNQKEAVSAS